MLPVLMIYICFMPNLWLFVPQPEPPVPTVNPSTPITGPGLTQPKPRTWLEQARGE